jgi:para-nitrobenzyl esterase
MIAFQIFLLAASVMTCVQTIPTQNNPVVKTQNGYVQGYVVNGIQYYYGIPFAQPPLNNLRFKPPQPVNNWGGILDATTPSPACMQTPVQMGIHVNTSEDCLYLNVYAPLNAPAGADLPVVVWIYGGSFKYGWGSLYDGSWLVNTGNIVLVTFNYRLGAFGLIALPELQKENSTFPTTGLYFLQDQRAALQWVQNNIRNFGGNPNDITLAGESAGAISTCIHYTDKYSESLFQAAIMESGFCGLQSLQKGIDMSNSAVDKAGCKNAADRVACLRKLTAEELFKATNSFGWVPSVDGVELDADPVVKIKSGKIQHKPLLIGANRNEASYFICGDKKAANLSAWEYVAFVVGEFGYNEGISALGKYPITNEQTAVQALINLETDYIFKCPSTLLASGLSNASVPVYFYSFEQTVAANMWPGSCWGVPHTTELVFLFSSLPFYTLNAEDKILSKAMLNYWTTFARTKNPNFASSPMEWPLFGNSSNYIVLKHNIQTGTSFRTEFCPTFWWNFAQL